MPERLIHHRRGEPYLVRKTKDGFVPIQAGSQDTASVDELTTLETFPSTVAQEDDEGGREAEVNEQRAARIAGMLLDIGAVILKPNEPFRYASGILSPIYTDNRLIMGFPEHRELVASSWRELLQERKIRPELVVGTATAGIAPAAWLADALALPMAYVRSSAKEHGRGRATEGKWIAGQSAIVVEDLISTGGSALTTAAALRDEGVSVSEVLAVFSYELPETRANFRQAGLEYYPLTTLPTLLRVALDSGRITEEERAIVLDWVSDPKGWEQRRAEVIHGEA